MSDDFITIREATKLTNRADITIRRLIKQLIKQNDPEISQMIRQETTKGGFVYKINKNFLLEKLKISEPERVIEEKIEKRKTETPEMIKELIETLKNQLVIKDRQIEGLSNKIDELIERNRETNIIIKSLQDRVFLLEGAKMRQNGAKNEPETPETGKIS